MLKYVGKYRVVCPFDQNGKPIKDDTSLMCKDGAFIYRYTGSTLVYYISRRAKLRLEREFRMAGVKCTIEVNDVETLVYFQEKDLDKVLDVVKPLTAGKSYKPWSVRNKRFSKRF